MKPINVRRGDRVEYLGAHITRDDGAESLAAGDIGEVLEVVPPSRGHGVIVDDDGEEIEDKDRDGYARVKWPRFRVTLIRVESEGSRWRKI